MATVLTFLLIILMSQGSPLWTPSSQRCLAQAGCRGVRRQSNQYHHLCSQFWDHGRIIIIITIFGCFSSRSSQQFSSVGCREVRQQSNQYHLCSVNNFGDMVALLSLSPPLDVFRHAHQNSFHQLNVEKWDSRIYQSHSHVGQVEIS